MKEKEQNINHKVIHLEYEELKYIKRCDILKVRLEEGFGSEQGGDRFCVVIQNDDGNEKSPTIIVAFITSKLSKSWLPTHVRIAKGKYGLSQDSMILLEQIRTLDKKRIIRKTGHLDAKDMHRLNTALVTSIVGKKYAIVPAKKVKKAQTQKTILSQLPEETREYIVNKLKFIRASEEYIDMLKLVKGDEQGNNLVEVEKLNEETALRVFCRRNKIDYDKVYLEVVEITKDERKTSAVI